MSASLRIEIFPSDLQRCVEFYQSVLRFKIISNQPEHSYAFFRRDSIRIGAVVKPASTYPDGKGAEVQYRTWPTGVEIVFEVDDLDEERKWILEKGWTLDEDIKAQFWGLTDFRIRDPDGYYIRITNRVKKT